MFLTFKVVFRNLMADLSISFSFYSGHCFDNVVVLFNSLICVWGSIHIHTYKHTHTHTHTHTYIYIYIYNPQKDCFVVSQLFSVARHVGRLKLESKPAQLYVRFSSRTDVVHLLACYKALSNSFRLFTFSYLTEYQSAQFVWPYASGSRKFLHRSAQPPWRSVYIVIHWQTVSLYHNYSM